MPDQQRLPAPPARTESPAQAGPAPAGVGNAERLARLRARSPSSEADYAAFLAQERREKSNGNHMSFLDRGLQSSPAAGQVGRIPERLATDPSARGARWAPAASALGVEATDMPDRGQRPEITPIDFLHGDIQNASVVVGTKVNGEMQGRWYGRSDHQNDQFWSATKHVQALGLIQLINKRRPDLDIDTLSIREAGKPGTEIDLHALMQDIVSYDAGPQRSNAGAATLGRMMDPSARTSFVQGNTGHAMELAGGYGGGTLFTRPEIVTKGGEVVATAPASAGVKGQNMVSAYDLTRMMAQAAWHPHLDPEERIEGAQWSSIESVMRAMGEDSARYVDAAIDRLKAREFLDDLVIVTKLGHGIRSATGNAETVYTGMVQFSDKRQSPPVQRSVCFTLRGVRRDPVELDARMAAEVTAILERVLDGSL